MRFAASGREPGMFTIRSSEQPLSFRNNCYKPVHGFSKGFPQVIHLAAPVILRLFHSEFPCFFRKNRFSPQKCPFIHRLGRPSSTGPVENSFYPQPKTYDGLSISLSSICNTSDVFAPYFLHKAAADCSHFAGARPLFSCKKGAVRAAPLSVSPPSHSFALIVRFYYTESPSAKLQPRPQSNGAYITWSEMQPASCR